jgi:hypothetical protein
VIEGSKLGGGERKRVDVSQLRNGTYPECSTGAACCLTNCLKDLTSSIIKCLIPFVESSCSNPKSNGTSHNGSSAGSCQTDRLLSASVSVRMRRRYRCESTAGRMNGKGGALLLSSEMDRESRADSGRWRGKWTH